MRRPFDSLSNTEVSRQAHYREYLDQVKCLYLQLDNLLDRMRTAGIYDDAAIIIHGDHGARIVMNDPTADNRRSLTQRDLTDGFSTLFAMKLPGKAGRYDRSPRPLEGLLAMFVFEAGLTSAKIMPEDSAPYVYLTSGDENFVRTPYAPPN
jgi:arylsulfatase A-like enzyme